MQSFGKVVRIHTSDSVAVALHEIASEEQIDLGDRIVTIKDDIKTGHKVAIRDIKKDEDIIKYGYPIGHATQNITQGSFVHSRNMKTNLEGLKEYSYNPSVDWNRHSNFKDIPTFDGYLREDGQAGVRNEIWIIPTVGCVNKTAEKLALLANEKYKGRAIDGIFSFGHPNGCSQLGDDHRNTQKILSGLIKHPNAGGVLVIGLGCENNNIEEMKKVLGKVPERVEFLNTQDIVDEIEEGLALLDILVNKAEGFKRQSVPISKLKVGLKCGGSDGFSGITANPLIGAFSDMLVSLGGTSILTEVPEMFGAETILMDRCMNREIFDKTVCLINDFKSYFLRYGQTIYENPSPGNKEGGITTLEEKSLGCTQKGGTSPVVSVLKYGEQAVVSGLNLMNGPGNDIVSTTALTAAGAHLVLFSTGRGTPLGCPVPTVKISSNSELDGKKPKWIDYNAGVILEGQTIERSSQDFFDLICQIASGKKARNEENDYREIAIFKDGVTL